MAKKCFVPEVDMFASPGNAQLRAFVSRWPHHQAIAVNALDCDLQPLRQVYADPPLDLNFSVASETSEEPAFDMFDGVAPLGWDLMVAPVSETAHPGDTSDFSAPEVGHFPKLPGGMMPPTKWPLLCLLLSGRHYKENKFRLKISNYIQQKNLYRYDRAFRRLWAFCVQGGTPRICPERKLPAGY